MAILQAIHLHKSEEIANQSSLIAGALHLSKHNLSYLQLDLIKSRSFRNFRIIVLMSLMTRYAVQETKREGYAQKKPILFQIVYFCIYKFNFQKSQKKQMTDQCQQPLQLNNSSPCASNLETVRECVGVLYAIWRDKKGEVKNHAYGSGFLVAERILMTCTHCIYSSEHRRYADHLEFAPNIESGSVGAKCQNIRRKLQKQSTNAPNYQIKWFYNFCNVKDTYKCPSRFAPNKYEICLVVLEESETTQRKFVSLGEWRYQCHLAICGYPASESIFDFKKNIVKRAEIKYFAQTSDSRDHILRYKGPLIQTSGVSGGPILALNEQTNEPYVIGIHTHRLRQQGLKGGVFFNKELIEKIKSLENDICVEHSIPKRMRYEFETIQASDSDGISTTESQKKGKKVQDEKAKQNPIQENIAVQKQTKQASDMSEDSDRPPSKFNLFEGQQQSEDISQNSSMSELDGILEFYSVQQSNEFPHLHIQSTI